MIIKKSHERGVIFIVLKNIIFGLLLLLFYLNVDYLYKQALLLGGKEVTKLNAVSTIYKASYKDSLNIQELDYIKKAIPIVDNFLGISVPIKFDIYFKSGDCSGLTLPKSKLIIMNYCVENFSPFVHEYIHVIFGVFDELWFQEGFATYLSLYILSESPLKGIKDQNTLYFFDAWYSDKHTNVNWYDREKLSYIDDLKLKYNRKDVISILKFNKKVKFEDLPDPVEFYRLSSAFCEYLSHEIGIKKLIEIAHLKTWSNKSIIKIGLYQDIDLQMYFDNWLQEFKAL